MSIQVTIAGVDNGYVVTARAMADDRSGSTFLWKKVYNGLDEAIRDIRQLYYEDEAEGRRRRSKEAEKEAKSEVKPYGEKPYFENVLPLKEPGDG